MSITIVVAIGHNNELGVDNKLLWNIPNDLKHFKKLTTGNTVVMGRKTYESIGKPLPNRKNIVLTRNNKGIAGCYVVNSVNDVLNLKEDVFVIGGQQIYELFLPYADTLVITHVDNEYPNADTFFPSIDCDLYNQEIIENNYDIEPYYCIIKYTKK